MDIFRLLDVSLEELIFLMMEPIPHPSACGWELPKPFRDPWKLGKNVDPVDPRPLFPLSLWNQQRPLRFTANEIFLASLPLRRLEQRNSFKKRRDFLGNCIKWMHLEGAGMSRVLNPGKCWINPLISSLLSSQVSSESSSGTFVYQGFVRGKGFGQFGLQRLGKIPWICSFSLKSQSSISAW